MNSRPLDQISGTGTSSNYENPPVRATWNRPNGQRVSVCQMVTAGALFFLLFSARIFVMATTTPRGQGTADNSVARINGPMGFESLPPAVAAIFGHVARDILPPAPEESSACQIPPSESSEGSFPLPTPPPGQNCTEIPPNLPPPEAPCGTAEQLAEIEAPVTTINGDGDRVLSVRSTGTVVQLTSAQLQAFDAGDDTP